MQIDSVGLLSKEASTFENTFCEHNELHRENLRVQHMEPDLSNMPPPTLGGPFDPFLNSNPELCHSAGVLTPNEDSFK